MKKKVEIKKNYNFLLVFVVVVLSIVGMAWYFGIFSELSNNSAEVTERVISTKGPLDISLIVPTKFSSEERFGTLTLSSNEGEINIAYNATNYDDLMSHLKNSRNRILDQLDSYQKTRVNDYDGLIANDQNEKTYYVYAGSAVYFLSTSSPELYDELDAIAQSFQYLGD
jgi:uncharacterized protein (UPF0333 family)